MKTSRSRRMKLLLLIVLTLVVLWLWGDFVHSRIVAGQLRKFEASIKRDENGVREGCQAYTIGDGETALLLVHGINDSPKVYQDMAPLLAQEGFTCRAMRLPRFATPLQEYAKTNRREWIDAVGTEVEQLRKSHQRVCIIAHSLGGAITINYVLKNSGAVDAVVLLAPAVEVNNERSKLLSAEGWHNVGKRLLAFTWFTKSPYENDIHDPEKRDYPWRTRFTPISVFEETFRLLEENRGRADEFNVPLMMCLSKDDKVVDWQAAQQFYEDAASSTKEIYFVDDAGHVLPIDNGWKDMTLEIAKFAAKEES